MKESTTSFEKIEMIRALILTLMIHLWVNWVAPSVGWAASQHVLYLGGGGDPANRAGTIFDEGLKELGRYLTSSQSTSEIRYNGGHPESEAILKAFKTSPDSRGPLTPDSFQESIQRTYKTYLEKFKSGTIAPGDQLLVIIDSHGAKRDSKEVTHSIAVSKRAPGTSVDNLPIETTQSLDALKGLVELAKASPLKLAIVDLSCFSGTTQSLVNLGASAPDQVCIVSSSGTEEYGYTSFSRNFQAAMKPGASIEDIFLSTRSTDPLGAFPMISTPAGREVAQRLYELFRPHFRWYRAADTPGGDPIDNLSEDLIKEARTCEREPSNISDLIREIERLKRGTASQLLNTSHLETLLRQYEQRRSQAVAGFRRAGFSPDLDRSEDFSVEVAVAGKTKKIKERVKYSWEQLATLDFDSILAVFHKDLQKAKDPESRASSQSYLEGIKKAQARKNELMLSRPELIEFEARKKQVMAGLVDTAALVTQIVAEERKIYQALYSDLSNPPKTNACNDFKL